MTGKGQPTQNHHRVLSIDYSVSTVSRPRDYVHDLLPHLSIDVALRLVLGSPECSYLDRYRHRPNTEILQVPLDEWERFKNCSLHHRASWNYWRSVGLCADRSDRDGVLVFEDDVLPSSGWRRRLDEIIWQIEPKYGAEYVLTLYSVYDLVPDNDNLLYAFYPPQFFYGTQAVYYPEQVRLQFAGFLWQHGVEVNERPYDFILKAFLKQSGVRLFAAVPSLVQHVGTRGTGLGGFHHRAAYFQKHLFPGMNPWKRADHLCRFALREVKRRAMDYAKRRRVMKTGDMDFSNHVFGVDGVRRASCAVGWFEIEKRQRQWRRYVEELRPPAAAPKDSKGIVMFAGGLRYLTCAWISIQILRRRGCTLPVELWHLDNEMTEGMREELAKHQVECRNLNHVTRADVQHFAAKPFALLYSRFSQTLYLDADNLCTRDPSRLLDHPQFQRTGAVFWPDYWKTERRNPMWKVIGRDWDDALEQDSGQLLLDKTRTWRELNLCCFFNLHWRFYYQLLMGDKDTFRFAWMALGTPFHMIPHEPGSCGYVKGKDRVLGVTMVQHDFSGEALFLHRNSLKWDVTRDSEMVWEKIRRFRNGARERHYRMSHIGHLALELDGDTETVEFNDVFPGLEKECLDVLSELRKSPFYQKYLIDYYISIFRR